MEISRALEHIICTNLRPNKVVILLGARRVGKTQLLQKVIDTMKEKALLMNGDDMETHLALETQSARHYTQLLGDCRFMIIDEAQEIPAIGKKLKLMVDSIKGLKVLITGSSAFELHNQTGEPLVGRMRTFYMFPIAQLELALIETPIDTTGNLEERLVLGSYPELFHLQSREEKIQYLKEIVYSYLLKDVFTFEGIKKRDKILALLQKLAFRVGSEVSLEALGRELQISKNTVEKYLDLFKKVFVIYDVSGFSRNRDNEITKMKKWYFVDNGIRNALINNFNQLNMRDDSGLLWENYLQSERMKKLTYEQSQRVSFFWRTHAQQEINRIETEANVIYAYEYKWGQETAQAPISFIKSYPEAIFQCVNKGNYLQHIVG